MKNQPSGSIVNIGSAWYCRYWEKKNVDGVIVRKRFSSKLCEKTKLNTTRAGKPRPEVFELSRKEMSKRSSSPIPCDKRITLVDFAEQVWMPDVEKHLKPSTLAAYRVLWTRHLRPQSGGLWIADVKCFHIQNILNALTKCANPSLSRNTLKRLKSTISAIFSLAKQQGYYDFVNPAQGSKTDPSAPAPVETHAYSLEEIETILGALDEPAATIFSVAAFAGLRQGELEGLRWRDYRNGELNVSRAIWNGRVIEPKTRQSKAAVPVIRQLRERLDMHKAREEAAFRDGARVSPPTDDLPIFATAIGTPLVLTNLVVRHIKPALEKCVHCGRSQGITHLPATHDFEQDDRLPRWSGWHGARRGLGSNLYRLGVFPVLIQRILRHTDLSTTMRYYVKATDDDLVSAMQKLEAGTDALGKLDTICPSTEGNGDTPQLLN